VITLAELVQHLPRRSLGAWSVVERVEDSAFAADQPARQRRDHRTRLSLIVHLDVPRGRGSARLDVDAVDVSAADLVDQAISLASAAIGPAWTSAPPAAPAKVDLVDPDLVDHDLGPVAAGTLARLRRPAHLTTTAAIHVLREKRTVVASSGFHTTWLATALRGEAVLASADHSLTVARRARRRDDLDLDLDAALADATADLALLDTAAPPIPGPCALWLGPEVLVPDPAHFHAGPSSLGLDGGATATARAPDDPTAPTATTATTAPLASGPAHGLWTVFAQQADSAIERRGLTRYRLRADIARGASQLAEPLSITSNGALDFAALSAPVTDDAVAIRTFPLIDRGIAVGLGLSPREAAMRNTDPNGGIRNLIVSPGTWLPAPSPTVRTIEVRRLRAITIDPTTGDATLDIALALDHRPDHATPTPFTGGTLHLDLITALARARRSPQLLRRGAYHGPAAILIDEAELLP
jgi:hypothetical protein